jgi:hypothetical protein
MCGTRQDISFYQVQYDTYGKHVTSVTPISTTTNEAWAAAVGFFGCQPSAGGFQNDCGIETDIVWDPFIGAGGAFVVAFQAWSGSSHPATKNQPIIMISQTPDPTNNSGWNTYAPFDVSPNDVNTDTVPHIHFDYNGLCLTATNTILDPSSFSSVLWCWGRDTFPTMNSVSFAGVNNLPVPDLKVGLSFGTAAQRPSIIVASSRDYTVGKSISEPTVVGVTQCDAAQVPTIGNCQSQANRAITETLNYVTWSDGHTGVFSKQAISTSKFFNAAGANCIKQGVSGQASPPDIIEPNGLNHRATNNVRTGYLVEDSSQNVWFSQSAGCSTTNGVNGFWTIGIDISTPGTPVLNTALTNYTTLFGGGAAGTLDASFPAVTLDSYGNVLWTFMAAGLGRFTSPGVLYKPVGTNTVAGPFYPDLNSGAATISTSGSSCSPSTNCASYTFVTTPDRVGLIIPAATGVFQFEDSTGSALTCILAGSSPATSASSVTNPTISTGAWGCPTTGKAGIRVRQSSGSASVSVYFQEKYWASRSSIACNQQGNGFSPTTDPDIVGVFGTGVRDTQNPNNIWLDNAVGLFNNACGWQTEGYGFIVHAPVTASSIVISPPSATITVAGTQALTNSTTFLDTVVSSCLGGSWVSSNPGAATVNVSSGLVTGVAPGVADISLVCEGTTSSTPSHITVSSGARNLVSISAAVSPTTIFVGNTATVTPTCTWDAAPFTDNCPGATAWTSSNGTVASITTNLNIATVTGLALGTAHFNLTYQAVVSSDSNTLTVAKPMYFPAHK